MIYLYLKTHNITGLKYLGKTNKKIHINTKDLANTGKNILINMVIMLQLKF